jgi:hypothetical protein
MKFQGGLMKEKDMTDEEYDALDELLTRTTPRVDLTKPGFFARQKGMLVAVDPVSAAYLRAQAEAAHTTPAQIINEMVRERIAVQ